MKKLIIGIIVTLALAATAFANSGRLEPANGSGGQFVQAAAQNGTKGQALTVYSTTLDLSNDLYWGIYCPADCKARLMPAANSTKANYHQFTIPGGSWYVRIVNKDTPFLNISGATNGEKQGQ